MSYSFKRIWDNISNKVIVACLPRSLPLNLIWPDMKCGLFAVTYNTPDAGLAAYCHYTPLIDALHLEARQFSSECSYQYRLIGTKLRYHTQYVMVLKILGLIANRITKTEGFI
jgi:hypothetical protein